jgi:hypothetical protein
MEEIMKNTLFLSLFFILSTLIYSNENESFIVLRDSDILYINDNIQNMAFINILENENSINIFIMLFNESETNVGKFYALLGLYECDRNLYNEFILKINSTDGIRIKTTRSADFSIWENFTTMIITIESGRWMKNFEENGMR